MVGFEILVNVSRDKRQEFIQTCDLISDPSNQNAACVNRKLYEQVKEANQFLWVEHWSDDKQMEAYLQSKRFSMLLGAISILADSNRLILLETHDWEDSDLIKRL
jgi:quinol monooxygenase YgiN